MILSLLLMCERSQFSTFLLYSLNPWGYLLMSHGIADTELLLSETFQQLKSWVSSQQSYILVSDKMHQAVSSLSCVWLFVTSWAAARQVSLSFTISWSFLKLMSIESVMPSNHLILCRPLLLPPSIFPSIRVFSNKSALLIRWPKYWSFSFSIRTSNGHSGLISFRIDWFDILVVQGILKSLLRDHSLKASILWCSAVFMVQFLHPYMTTGKTIALNIQTLVAKWCFCFLICCLVLS